MHSFVLTNLRRCMCGSGPRGHPLITACSHKLESRGAEAIKGLLRGCRLSYVSEPDGVACACEYNGIGTWGLAGACLPVPLIGSFDRHQRYGAECPNVRVTCSLLYSRGKQMAWEDEGSSGSHESPKVRNQAFLGQPYYITR